MSPETQKSHPFESQRAEAGRKCLPQQLSRLSRLQNLNLSLNYLTGEIPVNLSHCVKLKSLVLEHNTLVGNNNQAGLFPGSIGNLTSLEELYLSYNNLEGQVPASLARLTKLRIPGLSVNSLSGEFPPPLQLLPNLQILYLAKCQFIGSIPSSLANASKSLELDFPINNFTGNIPKGFGNLRNLLWLNVWSNQFGHGKHDDLDFVNSLTNCRSLQMLHFRDNQFVGTLPHSAVNLSTQLQSLLFYGNRISGSIPKEISNLVNLNLFKLSNNNLTVFLYWRRNLKDQPAPEYRFKSARFYPNISFGTVYKGTFASDGTVIAVKVLKLQHEGASKSFLAECQALGNIRHQ
uniref:Receptor kinase-like protein, putative n=1 Tax=Solanum demissum TaxID=50514 RepID=Q60D14_SOLDE|nr:Receptor kinase-like protein, putative [Solanum demissum]